MAIAFLYERVLPLLECKHRWRPLLPTSPAQLVKLDEGLAISGNRIHTCISCTAYVLARSVITLPVVGRGIRAVQGDGAMQAEHMKPQHLQ